MSYALTVARVALGDGLRERAEHALRSLPEFPKALAAEINQARDRFIRNALRKDESALYVRMRTAQNDARASAIIAEKAAGHAAQAERVLKEAPAHQVEGATTVLVTMRTAADDAYANAKKYEAAANELVAQARKTIGDAPFKFVEDLFELQIQSGLTALVALVSGIGDAKTVRFQIAGHVEDQKVGTGQCNVHVWPGDP